MVNKDFSCNKCEGKNTLIKYSIYLKNLKDYLGGYFCLNCGEKYCVLGSTFNEDVKYKVKRIKQLEQQLENAK